MPRVIDGHICPNCGTSKHLQCCARCGRKMTTKQRTGSPYCTKRCADEQHAEDQLSAEIERNLTKKES